MDIRSQISSSRKFAKQRPWTTYLSLPQLDCLHMDCAIQFPITRHFKQLPTPLPFLEAPRGIPLNLDHLEGIARVRCYRIRLSKHRVQLQSLRALEMGVTISCPDWDFAPNLEVMAITNSLETPEELVCFPFLKHVKQFGYLYCREISPPSSSSHIRSGLHSSQETLSHLSSFQNLEHAVVLRQSGYRPGLTHDDVVSFSGVLPRLRQLSVFCSEDFGRNESHEKTIQIWIRTPANASEAMRIVDSQDEWRLTHKKVLDVWEGIRTLLGLL